MSFTLGVPVQGLGLNILLLLRGWKGSEILTFANFRQPLCSMLAQYSPTA